jgi:mannose-6-phosphate isomerase-like protein (cupin superfamily)
MLGSTVRTVKDGMVRMLGQSQGPPERLRSGIYPVTLPLHPEDDTGFRLYHRYRGSTGNVDSLSCHVSALAQGQCPHPPHAHPEEEILIMLGGEADVVLPSCLAGQRRLTAGQFVYYPAHFPHTLKAVSAQPANYLMFKWRAAHRDGPARLGFQHVDLADVHPAGARSSGFESRLLFEGPTGCLGKLHAHLSFLAPGAGYEPHVDEHDGAIVLLAGEIETLGHRVRPHGIVHFARGEPHGVRNHGPHPARYLVFEFHGRVPLLRKLVDAKRWKRKLYSVWRVR